MIPEDIKRAVEAGFPGNEEASVENIHKLAGLLVTAERERCAKIADELRKASTPGSPLFGAGMCNAADHIATAIRAGAPE